MFKLLNRLAWILSLSFGFIIAFIIIGSNGYRINSEEIFFSGVFGIIAGLIIKKVLFSKTFIETRLKYFANSIKENYINTNENSPIIPFLKGDEDKYIHKEEILNTKIVLEKTENTVEENEPAIDLSQMEEKKDIRIEENIKATLNEKEKINGVEDLKNNENYTTYHNEPSQIEIFFNKIGDYVKEFFSTNLLAKLGSILVFLAVVYFLKGVATTFWHVIGPVGRIIIGILIGLGTIGIGMKIHSKYEKEGLILMGTGVLINFAVILAGRYLVGENGYLTEGMTFFFLILNTIVGVLLSLIYKSKTLLIFSFIFAYLNPFIIGAESNGQPYTLIGYSLIISLAGLFLSIKRANLTLLIISFIAGNFLFLVAPFSDSIGWSSKIILTSIFSLLTIIGINKFKGLNSSVNKLIINIFIGTYIYIILNLINSGSILSETLSFIIYNIILVSLFIFTIKLLSTEGFSPLNKFNPLNLFLFIPLIILIGILFSGNLVFSPFVLISTLIIYLITFSLLKITSNIFSYFFFGILGLFILIFNLNIGTINTPNITEFLTLIITSLIFLFSSYYYSKKENLVSLFPIGTLGTIFLLAPIIQNDYIFESNSKILNSAPLNILEFNTSIIAIIVFVVANLILPFINKQLLEKKSLSNLIFGSVLAALFFAFEIYNFGEIHFPGVIEGFAFLGLAIVYFIQGYFIANKLGFEKIKNDSSLQNTFYSFIAISISLFSVAIAFVFSDYPEIISTTWLFEATIIYFFYSKTNNPKVFFGATILFIIGLVKFGILLDTVHNGDFKFLVSFAVILASFILNLYFINKAKPKAYHNIHHILHLIGMGIMGGLLIEIIPSSGHGWSMLGISIFITILGSFYVKYNFTFLKIIFIIVLGGFSIFHIGLLDFIFHRLKKDDLEILKIMQYIVSSIIIFNYLIWKKISKTSYNYLNKSILIIIGIYAFIISNLYILDLFKNIFGYYTLTIYWGFIASSLIFYGIQKDIIKYRTLGLYFLILTASKIFFSDVWQISNTNARWGVFLVLGIVLIVLSTMYSKRFGDNWKGELNLQNLKDNELIKKEIENDNYNEELNDDSINNKIKDIDVSKYKGVKFKFNNGKSISIRAENLIKITKLVTNMNNKTSFEAGELKNIYDYIVNNYKTELSPSNYKKILEIMEKFVEFGGEVEFIEK